MSRGREGAARHLATAGECGRQQGGPGYSGPFGEITGSWPSFLLPWMDEAHHPIHFRQRRQGLQRAPPPSPSGTPTARPRRESPTPSANSPGGAAAGPFELIVLNKSTRESLASVGELTLRIDPTSGEEHRTWRFGYASAPAGTQGQPEPGPRHGGSNGRQRGRVLSGRVHARSGGVGFRGVPCQHGR